MDRVEVKNRESSIVLVGSFNPLVMAPHWFVKNGLIPQEDVTDSLEIDVVYSELTKFTLGNIGVEITQNKMVLRSSLESHDVRIHDLALSVLALVRDAEVSALGLNVYNDWYFHDVDDWHRVGDMLAPKQPWLNVYPASPRVGLAKMQMQVKKPEGMPGVFNLGVSWLDEKKWIRFSVNDHYDGNYLGSSSAHHVGGTFQKSKKFDPVTIISTFWMDTLRLQRDIAAQIVEQARES